MTGYGAKYIFIYLCALQIAFAYQRSKATAAGIGLANKILALVIPFLFSIFFASLHLRRSPEDSSGPQRRSPGPVTARQVVCRYLEQKNALKLMASIGARQLRGVKGSRYQNHPDVLCAPWLAKLLNNRQCPVHHSQSDNSLSVQHHGAVFKIEFWRPVSGQ